MKRRFTKTWQAAARRAGALIARGDAERAMKYREKARKLYKTTRLVQVFAFGTAAIVKGMVDPLPPGDTRDSTLVRRFLRA